MMRIGIATGDTTPSAPVWLAGYSKRTRRSEGVYLPLGAGAISLQGEMDEVVLLTSDQFGFAPTFVAQTKEEIAGATGLAPRQIILTATHTHGAPLILPLLVPGEIETDYAAGLQQQLVALASAARERAVRGRGFFSRGSSAFGVNRRCPGTDGRIHRAPYADGPVDRHLDTLWFEDSEGRLLGTLTSYGCHPASTNAPLVGSDYPGYLCRALHQRTGAPALFATGCGGDVRPWFQSPSAGFARPTMSELDTAGQALADEVLRTKANRREIDGRSLSVAGSVLPLPYAAVPTREELAVFAAHHNHPAGRLWADRLVARAPAPWWPAACPQEIQLLRLGTQFLAVFLAGELFAEIGLQLKEALGPSTVMTIAYANGLIGYVPGSHSYDWGGYEIDRGHWVYLQPAAFARTAEELIVAHVRRLAGEGRLRDHDRR